ncbi:MAG: ABC transporter ATP-binding protein [Chloroflexales bacterium]|nr:ABC transporter ATP-binding protein [Chloroflexales bacterium]
MSIGEPVIQLDDVSVHYRRALQPSLSLKEYVLRWLQRDLAFQDVWALRDVSLRVRRGEVLGILGANGAGKSTLLKVISRVLRPSSGRVRVHGLVAPLLELGGGFNPELTGRENIFLESAALGFSYRETATRVGAIVDFAGLHDCIDGPLRTYSTGQTARLGFAVATAVQPELLIVDEILSVGDGEFQQRSFERIERFRANGTTILLVSHQMPAIMRLCDRAAWLDQGQLMAFGSTADVATRYQQHWFPHSVAARPAPPVRNGAGLALHLDGAPALHTTGWHIPEHSAMYGIYRWTGPDTRSTLLLPVGADADLLIRIAVLHALAPDILASMRLLVNDHPTPLAAHQTPEGLIIFEGQVARTALDPAASQIRLSLLVNRTGMPDDVPGQRPDMRLLGVAIAWVQALALPRMHAAAPTLA